MRFTDWRHGGVQSRAAFSQRKRNPDLRLAHFIRAAIECAVVIGVVAVAPCCDGSGFVKMLMVVANATADDFWGYANLFILLFFWCHHNLAGDAGAKFH